MTRVELNKRARNKEQRRKEAESKKLKGISKEIDRYTLVSFLLHSYQMSNVTELSLVYEACRISFKK